MKEDSRERNRRQIKILGLFFKICYAVILKALYSFINKFMAAKMFYKEEGK